MKKVLFKIGLVLLFAAMFVGCGDKNTMGGGVTLPITIDDSDITESVTTGITLKDGKYKFIDTDYFFGTSIECGTFTISNSESTFTYIEAWGYNDGLLQKYSQSMLNNMNAYVNKSKYDFPADATDNGWVLLTNSDTINKKYSIKKEGTQFILLEKIE